MNAYPRVRQNAYTSKRTIREEHQMYPYHLMVGERMAQRQREADAHRLSRQALDHRRAGTSWSRRARLRVGNSLVAAGDALRRPADDCGGSKVANRPA